MTGLASGWFYHPKFNSFIICLDLEQCPNLPLGVQGSLVLAGVCASGAPVVLAESRHISKACFHVKPCLSTLSIIFWQWKAYSKGNTRCRSYFCCCRRKKSSLSSWPLLVASSPVWCCECLCALWASPRTSQSARLGENSQQGNSKKVPVGISPHVSLWGAGSRWIYTCTPGQSKVML